MSGHIRSLFTLSALAVSLFAACTDANLASAPSPNATTSTAFSPEQKEGQITGVFDIATQDVAEVDVLKNRPQTDGKVSLDGLDFSIASLQGGALGGPYPIQDNQVQFPPLETSQAQDVQFSIHENGKPIVTGSLKDFDLTQAGTITITASQLNITDSNVIKNKDNQTGGDSTNVIVEDGETGDIQIGDNS